MFIRALFRPFGVFKSAFVRAFRRKGARVTGRVCGVERSFNTVFYILPPSRREELINYYQRRKNCSRVQAMERAIEDRARENGVRL
jgi:hypothetical protein